MRVVNFFLGLVTGALIGAAAVLLTTPNSGAETQQKLKEQRDTLLEIGKQAATARRAELEAQIANFRKNN